MALCEPGLLLHIEIMMHGLSKISPEFGNVPVLVARPGVGRGALQHRVVSIHFLFRVRLVVLRDKTVLKRHKSQRVLEDFCKILRMCHLPTFKIRHKCKLAFWLLSRPSISDKVLATR